MTKNNKSASQSSAYARKLEGQRSPRHLRTIEKAAHRDTGKDLSGSAKQLANPLPMRPRKGQFMDYMREWGLMSSNRRYDE